MSGLGWFLLGFGSATVVYGLGAAAALIFMSRLTGYSEEHSRKPPSHTGRGLSVAPRESIPRPLGASPHHTHDPASGGIARPRHQGETSSQ
jgi:hypothetical protein